MCLLTTISQSLRSDCRSLGFASVGARPDIPNFSYNLLDCRVALTDTQKSYATSALPLTGRLAVHSTQSLRCSPDFRWRCPGQAQQAGMRPPMRVTVTRPATSQCVASPNFDHRRNCTSKLLRSAEFTLIRPRVRADAPSPDRPYCRIENHTAGSLPGSWSRRSLFRRAGDRSMQP